MSKRKPTGFVAVCQCGVTIGAMDLTRTNNADAGRVLGRWLYKGCTVEPRFDGAWEAQIQRCQCEQPPIQRRLNDDNQKNQCKEGADVEPCPKCGHETPAGARFEDVWGGCDDNNCVIAMPCWNEAMRTTAYGKAEDAFNADNVKTGGMPYGTYGGY